MNYAINFAKKVSVLVAIIVAIDTTNAMIKKRKVDKINEKVQKEKEDIRNLAKMILDEEIHVIVVTE